MRENQKNPKQQNQEKSPILVPESAFSSRECFHHALPGLAEIMINTN